MAKYIYKFDYSIMANSALKVWAYGDDSNKHLFIIPQFKTVVAGEIVLDESKLINAIKNKFSLDEVEVEQYTS